MNTYNYKQNLIKKQAFQSAISKVDVQTVKNLSHEIRAFNKSERAIANLLIATQIHNGLAYFSQETIGKQENINLGRYQVNRIIRKFVKIGFVYVKRRWNNSNIYFVNPYLMSTPFIHDAVHSLESLKRIFLASIIMALGAYFDVYATLRNKNIAIRKINNIIIGPLGSGYMHKVMNATRRAGPIPEFIKTLPFDLELNQKVFLCAYPLAALEYAKERLGYATRLKHPWFYFLAKCREYCQDNNIEPDWSYIQQLKQRYNLKENFNLDHAKLREPTNEQPEPLKQENRQPSIKQQIQAMAEPKKVAYSSHVYEKKEKPLLDRTSREYIKKHEFKQEQRYPNTIQSRIDFVQSEIRGNLKALEQARTSNNPFLIDHVDTVKLWLKKNQDELHALLDLRSVS